MDDVALSKPVAAIFEGGVISVKVSLNSGFAIPASGRPPAIRKVPREILLRAAVGRSCDQDVLGKKTTAGFNDSHSFF